MPAVRWPEMPPLVVLIGPPGAGKSGVGRKLARLLDAPFIDTDSRIAQQYGPIADIFRTRGEEAFRALEREVVAKSLGESGVVSLGGGAILDEQTQQQLGDLAVVLLTVSAAAVAGRIRGSKRPLLTGQTAEERVEAWAALVESRRAVYEKLATATWDTSARPITAIAQEIAAWTRAQAEKRTEL